jgi:phosphoribosylformimino-5-aminoimidazole carboxamide ribotide isomerase
MGTSRSPRRFRPCIDLRQGHVIQVVGASLGDDLNAVVTNFTSDDTPASYARRYRQDGLPGGHGIALGVGNHEAGIEALQALEGGMQMGGGLPQRMQAPISTQAPAT